MVKKQNVKQKEDKWNTNTLPDDNGYVYVICKGCGQMYPQYDYRNEMKDEPLDNVFYCPTCQRKGFKNYQGVVLTRQDKMQPYFIEQFLKEQKIKDPIIKKEFKKRVLNCTSKNLSYVNILKQAKEVRSHYDD